MKVGALRDWELDVYTAVSPAGEEGIHLRFRRLKERFVVFLGIEAIEALAAEVMRTCLELAAAVEDRGC